MSDCMVPDLSGPVEPELPEPIGELGGEVAVGEPGYADLDGDGYTETTFVDSNADGEIDAVLTDVDGDFYDDVALFDNSPGDGHFVPDVAAVALDGDGLADVIYDDVNFDGVVDVVTPGGDEPLPYANPYETSAGVAPTAQPFGQS